MSPKVTQPPRRLELVFFDAGGGHRAATEALAEVIAERHPTWQVTITNLQDRLKSADPLYMLTGVAAQDYYNAALRMGLTYGSRGFLRGLQAAIKLCAPHMEKVLRAHWAAQSPAPDLVVSLIPNFNGILFRALRAVSPATPFVTILTDMADTPPRFWMEDQDQYVICGSERAYRQAVASGFYRRKRLFKTSGMILRPAFYAPATGAPSRAALGLADDKPTALIMFGGYGAKSAATLVDRFNKAATDIQSIVMCGRNDELRRALDGKPHCAAIGYTRDVASYMRLADFFIGKPGPGSMSEAWRMGLPTIVECNARTMIQERPNVEIAEELGIGVGVRSFGKIAKVITTLQADGTFARMKKKLRRIDNRAVYEIPALLARIMDES